MQARSQNVLVLGMTFDFDAKARRGIGNRRRTLRFVHHLDGVHWFRLHPRNVPDPGRNWLGCAGLLPNAAIRTVIANMRDTRRYPSPEKNLASGGGASVSYCPAAARSDRKSTRLNSSHL